MVSGCIAYLADELGRKLGKKRLTIFKLRPRNTAKLFVVLSGMTASLLTILLVAIFSSGVRSWIVEGTRAISHLEKAKRDLSALQMQRRQLIDQNDSLSKSMLANQRTIAAQQSKIASQQAESQRLIATRDQLRADLNQRKADLAVKRLELAAKQKELVHNRTLLVAARESLRQTQLIRKSAVDQFNSVNTQNLNLTDANAKLQENIAKLEVDGKRLTAEKESLEGQRQKAEDDYEQAQMRLDQAQGRLAKVRDDLEKTQYALDTSNEVVSKVSSTFTKSRQEPLTYRRGEEVARMAIDAGMSEKQAEAALAQFLRTAKSLAAERGATGSEKFQAADIMDHPDVAMDRVLTSSDIRESLVRQMQDAKEDMVLVGYSTYNAFAGEPVSLEVAIYPNPLIYRQGQVLAESRIDGNRDQSVIFTQVSEFLGTKVNERARQDKMLPRSGADVQFGSLSPQEIIDLVQRVRAADRRVSLRAVVDSDTRAADLLHLRFAIR